MQIDRLLGILTLLLQNERLFEPENIANEITRDAEKIIAMYKGT